jgi:hypothetical protein
MGQAESPARDVYALQASWGCESALPYLWADANRPDGSHEPGALPCLRDDTN